MIEYTTGDILAADVEAVVNTVNTVSVMGKGLAKAFKELYPENFLAYETACTKGEVATGRMFVTLNVAKPTAPQLDMFGTGTPANPSPVWLVNFPTKRHWRNPSELAWIEEGLVALADFIRENNVRSIAIPPLGCGNGGLRWADVRPRIETALRDLRDCRILIFEPA